MSTKNQALSVSRLIVFNSYPQYKLSEFFLIPSTEQVSDVDGMDQAMQNMVT